MSEVICISLSEDEDEMKAKETRMSEKVFDDVPNNRKVSVNEDINNNKRFRLENDGNEPTTIKLYTNQLNNSFSDSSSSNKKFDPNSKCKNDEFLADINSFEAESCNFNEIEKNICEKTESIESSKKEFLTDTVTKDIKTKRITTKLILKEQVIISDLSNDTFANFLKACANDSRADDTIKIVIEKLQKKYDQLESFHKEDEEFQLFLNQCLAKIINKTSRFYNVMVDVKDEIKRRVKKSKVSEAEKNDKGEPIYTKDELKKLKILEKAIIECKERIKQLEMQEVDFDDEENSAFIKADRYKKRLILLYEKYSQVTNDKILRSEILKKSIKLKDIPGDMTGIPSIDEAILKFINSSIKKMNKLGHLKDLKANPAYLEAPDFVDVLKIIKKQNEKLNIGLNKKRINDMATKAYMTVGEYLQSCRIHEVREQILSYENDYNEENIVDPAIKDPELKKVLKKYKDDGKKKLDEIFQKYVDIQANLTNIEEELLKSN